MNKLFTVTILLLSSCAFEEKNSENEPSGHVVSYSLSGKMCFESNDSSNSECIHINVNKKNISGEIYTNDEYFGDVYYSFKGVLVSDSIMEVKVHNLNTDPLVTEKWKYHYDGSLLVFDNTPAEATSSEYLLIDCSELPDITNYGTVEDIESKELGEYLDNVFPIYYTSVSPNAMRHNGGLHEYFQILEVLDTVTGFGVGVADGVPAWEFDFTGKIVNDSIYLVNVEYRQEGHTPVSSAEEWRRDNTSGRLILRGYNRPKNGREYVSIDPDDLLAFIQDSLQNIDKRLQYHTVSPSELYEKRMK